MDSTCPLADTPSLNATADTHVHSANKPCATAATIAPLPMRLPPMLRLLSAEWLAPVQLRQRMRLVQTLQLDILSLPHEQS